MNGFMAAVLLVGAIFPAMAFAQSGGGHAAGVPFDSGVTNQLVPGTSQAYWLKQTPGGNRIVKNVPMKLSTQKVGAGDTVWGMLGRNGFVPNAEMVGVVQALNPATPDISRLKPGERITLPAIRGSAADTRFLMVDPGYRKSAKPYLRTLQLQESFANETYRADLQTLSRSVMTVQQSKRTVPAEFRAQVIREADAARKIQLRLKPVDSRLLPAGWNPAAQEAYSDVPKERLELAYAATVRNVSLAAEVVAKGLSFTRSIQVKTIDESSGSRKCRLVIWYASEFDYQIDDWKKYRKRLLTVSSPATGTLPRAELRVWAEWDHKPVSTFEPVDLKYGNSVAQLDLSVTAGGTCQ